MELLERETFLGALEEYAAAAATGTGRLVLLSGEAGIGKTSLVEAFEEAHPELAWLRGACDASFTPRPLGPVLEIAEAAGGDLVPLARDGGERSALFAAFVAHLARPSSSTVVVVEDIHWADEATLDWLSYVARRVGRTKALVVATYRQDEAALDPQLTAVIGRLAAHGATRRMQLPPLSATATGVLAAERGLDAERLFGLCGGNPFYVREVLEDPEREVPASVAEVVRARVGRHSAAAQRMLAAAAVVGRPAPARLLAAVAGVPAAVVDECVASGTLAVDDQRYAFTHELTRLAVEQDLPSYRAVELHEAALTVLTRERADHAELAHHAERAGDAARSYEEARAAAAAAVRFHSHREATVQLERALRAADRLGLDDGTRAGLLDELTVLHGTTDHWEDAAATNAVAVGIRRRLGDRQALGTSLRHRVLCLWRLCRSADARAAVSELLQLTEQAPGTAERAWALALQAYAGAEDGDCEDRARAADEAVRLGELLGLGELVAHAMQDRGLLCELAGADGLADIERALRVARGTGSVGQAARAFTNLYLRAVIRLEMDAFEWVWAEGMRWCEEHEMRTWASCLTATRTMTLVRRGRLDEASRLATLLLRHGTSPVNRAHLDVARLRILVRRGAADAHEEILRGRVLAASSGDLCWQLPVETALCELAWLRGDPDLVDEACLDLHARSAGTEPRLRAELGVGLARMGLLPPPSQAPPSPYDEELAGDHRAAAEAWRARGCPYEAALALAASGAGVLLEEALEAFTGLGTEPAAARTRQALRELGVRTGRGPRRSTRSHPAGLTSREAEVLALLAEGLTNAAIADRLVLSTRTVDHHVSAVLTKLGVTSRSDAARTAARLGTT